MKIIVLLDQILTDLVSFQIAAVLSVRCAAGVWGDTPSLSYYLHFTHTLPTTAKQTIISIKAHKLPPNMTLTPCKLSDLRRNGGLCEASSPVSGLISSSSFTMPSPCMDVQCLMGEPPPILLYCSWIFGVRRLAMNGPSLLQSGRQIAQLQLHNSHLMHHRFNTVNYCAATKKKKSKWPVTAL